GIDPERLVVVVDRAIVVALVRIGIRACAEGSAELGIAPDRLTEVLDGPIVVVLVVVGEPAIVVGDRGVIVVLAAGLDDRRAALDLRVGRKFLFLVHAPLPVLRLLGPGGCRRERQNRRQTGCCCRRTL